MQIGVESSRAVENKRVFVVDGDEITRTVLQFMLHDEYETHEFAELARAYDKAVDWKPDAVLLAIDLVEEGRRHDEIRLRWSSGSKLFPNFRGTVRFRIEQTFTRVLVDGSYAPPLGVLGAAFDRFIGRHLAARTLDDLAGRIARALEKREREWEAAHPAPVQ